MEITAREIIERLIDENKINGKEACILMEAINNKIIEYKPIRDPYPYTTPWITWYTSANDEINTIMSSHTDDCTLNK